MADEITSLEEAFGAAKAQLDGPPADDTLSQEDSPSEPATPDVDDQAEASNPDLQAFLNEVVLDDAPESTTDTTSDDFWNTAVELEEGTTIPLSEMRNGFLRQADYTRKTQALAEQRKQAENALGFYQKFIDDPQEFARAVAVDQGWLTSEQREPVTQVEGLVRPTEDEWNQQLDALVTERLEADPRLQQARQIEAQSVLDAKFAEIETSLGATLPNAVRAEIIAEASRRQNYDLELVTQYWIGQQREGRRSGDQLKNSASARPQSAGAVATEEVPVVVSTFEDAVLAAKAELTAAG